MLKVELYNLTRKMERSCLSSVVESCWCIKPRKIIVIYFRLRINVKCLLYENSCRLVFNKLPEKKNFISMTKGSMCKMQLIVIDFFIQIDFVN